MELWRIGSDRRMIQRCLTLCLVLNPRGILASDMDATMTSTWLARDWSRDKFPQETVSVGACICRLKSDRHVVCFGTEECVAFSDIKIPEWITDLRVKNTAIRRLAAGEMNGFRQLERLDVDANFQLTEIEPGFFAGMSRIANMSVSFNTELRFLREGTFDGLVNLRHLKLVKNGFRNILDAARAVRPRYLPSLSSLSLSENVFREINETSFAGMEGTKVRELNLVLCQIERMHPSSLKPFRRLERLRVGANPLDELQLADVLRTMAENLVPIALLSLYELGLRKGDNLTSLLLAISRLNITRLNLRRNRIESLYEGLFPVMPHLHTLDLREVSAVDIEPNALSQLVMPKLETLLLGGNKLSGVVPGVLLPQLSDLDLSFNSGTDSLPSYFDVNVNIFENMTRLTSLNLSYNRIATISNTTFNGVHHLRVLGLKNATIYYIAENSFAMLENLFLLNLEDNPQAPFNAFPHLIFEGLHRLQVLLLSNCGITHFRRTDIFRSLTVLRFLDLKDNNLATLHPDLLAHLPRLVGLDLSSNRLAPWDRSDRMFRFNRDLTIVLLSRNRFTHLTTTMMDDLAGIARADISLNPYVCDDVLLRAATSWLSSRNATTNRTEIFDPSVTCLTPPEWRDKPVIEFVRSADTGAGGYAGLAVALLLFAALLYAAITHYRRYVRYSIFLLKMMCLRRKTRRDAASYAYDAFVSYSHEDRNFVARLVSALENEAPYLKLCVYERDFEVGTVISETVMDKVEASRKVVFVVSDAFARSQWCIWELQLAECHSTFFRTRESATDSLVLIKLGHLADSRVSPILKYVMRTRIYLEWSSDCRKERAFWNKLRNCLM